MVGGSARHRVHQRQIGSSLDDALPCICTGRSASDCRCGGRLPEIRTIGTRLRGVVERGGRALWNCGDSFAASKITQQQHATWFKLRFIIMMSRPDRPDGCSGLSIDTTGTPEPSSLTSPEHCFSTKSTKNGRLVDFLRPHESRYAAGRRSSSFCCLRTIRGTTDISPGRVVHAQTSSQPVCRLFSVQQV